MKIIGVDYSISSPSITILNHGEIEKIYAIRATKKQESNNDSVILLDYPLYKTNLERYDKLSNLFLNFIPSDVTCAYIEGYSYGSNVGVVFNIAECTSLFKYKFYKKFGFELITVSPKEVKKFATGNGNCKKRAIVDKFKEIKFDAYNALGMIDINSLNIKSPIDDICDSYFVAKYGHNQESTQKS